MRRSALAWFPGYAATSSLARGSPDFGWLWTSRLLEHWVNLSSSGPEQGLPSRPTLGSHAGCGPGPIAAGNSGPGMRASAAHVVRVRRARMVHTTVTVAQPATSSVAASPSSAIDADRLRGGSVERREVGSARHPGQLVRCRAGEGRRHEAGGWCGTYRSVPTGGLDLGTRHEDGGSGVDVGEARQGTSVAASTTRWRSGLRTKPWPIRLSWMAPHPKQGSLGRQSKGAFHEQPRSSAYLPLERGAASFDGSSSMGDPKRPKAPVS
jgi:hypothetical protein